MEKCQAGERQQALAECLGMAQKTGTEPGKPGHAMAHLAMAGVGANSKNSEDRRGDLRDQLS